VKLEITVDGERETLEAFDKVERGTIDLRELGTWDWVQREFYKAVEHQFETEGGAGESGKWQELSTPYAEIKRAKYGEKPILLASGGMYTTLTTSGQGSVVEKTADEMTLGSTDPKSGWHNKGVGRNPTRKIFDFTDDQKKAIVRPIGVKLKALADNAKLRDIRGF
jgi:hypothetical protein